MEAKTSKKKFFYEDYASKTDVLEAQSRRKGITGTERQEISCRRQGIYVTTSCDHRYSWDYSVSSYDLAVCACTFWAPGVNDQSNVLLQSSVATEARGRMIARSDRSVRKTVGNRSFLLTALLIYMKEENLSSGFRMK